MRYIARHDCFGIEPDSREKHFHLLGGGILRLVEDDKLVVERPSAHERERRDLDFGSLNQSISALDIHHVV